jgi:hypothetical protein
MIANLSTLEGIDGPGNYLEVVVNNVKIKDKRTYMATSTAGSSATNSNSPAAAIKGTSATGASGLTSRTSTPPPQSVGRAAVAGRSSMETAANAGNSTTPRSGMGSLFGGSSSSQPSTTSNNASANHNSSPSVTATATKKSNFSFGWKSTE